MDKVSIIIPTYNRFKFLLNTIKSIQQQSYTNIEIIVINDCSTEQDYYNYKFDDIIMVHLDKNSKNIFGYTCIAYVRNRGIQISTGKYIAFCDDDDTWFPDKIQKQINAMKKTGCNMSSTEGLFGVGIYNPNKSYKSYNSKRFYNKLQDIYKKKQSTLLINGFPDIWDSKFLKIHNCMITSSVIIEKDILDKINNFKNMKPPGEDYDCWLRALEYTNSVYVKDICFYYDAGHGFGKNY